MIKMSSIVLLEYILQIIMTEGNYEIYKDCIFVTLKAEDLCIMLSEMEEIADDIDISRDTRDIVKRVIEEIKQKGGKA